MRLITACIDLETTGFLELNGYPTNCEIAQIAAIIIEDGREIDCFESKLEFDPTYAEDKALDIIHYDSKIWANEAKPSTIVLADLLEFLRQYSRYRHISNKGWNAHYIPVFGHNIRTFDIPFLRREILDKLDLEYLPIWPHPLDTYELATWYFFLKWPKLDRQPPMNFKLETVAQWFGIHHQKPHDALEDCRVNVKLARKLLLEMRELFLTMNVKT